MAVIPINEPILPERQLSQFTVKEEAWQAQGLCRGLDERADKIFYPEHGENNKQAKKLCQKCSVTEECLKYALEHNEKFGVWGGMTERERRRFKKQRSKKNGNE